jgi:hypothetical protein
LIATGFLAGLDGQRGFGGWGWVAVVLFVAGVGFCCALLWPRQWGFRLKADVLVGSYIEADPPATLDVMHRELALWTEKAYQENAERLDRMFVFFRLATVLMVAEIVIWIV